MEHKKEYADEAEEAMRRELFFNTLAEIEAHNADSSNTYTLGNFTTTFKLSGFHCRRNM